MKCMSGTIDPTTFVSMLVLDGAGVIRVGKEELEFRKGESLFITADTGNYEMEGACEVLVTTL